MLVLEQASSTADWMDVLRSTAPALRRHIGPLEPAADYAPVAQRLCAFGPRRLATFPQVLADLSDLSAGVALAEVLATGPRPSPPSVQIDDGRWLLAHVRRQLDSMDRFVEKRLDRPFRGTNRLAKMDELRADMTAAEGNAAALRRDLGVRARTYEQRLLALLRTLRRDGARIRSDAARDLRSFGSEAAYLERIDGGLRRATAAEVSSRDAGLAARVGVLAIEAMARCVFIVPVNDSQTEVPEVIREDAELRLERDLRRGALRDLRTSMDKIIRAVAAEERSLLLHLIRGVIDVRESSEGDEP